MQFVDKIGNEINGNGDNPTEEDSSYCVPCAAVKDEDVAPVDRIVIPADVADFSEDDDIIYVIGTREGKVTQILGLERMVSLKVKLKIPISLAL